MATAVKPVDIRDFKSDISLMQTVYGILLILGFRQLGDALYLFVTKGVGDWELLCSLTAGGIALALLGFRFFWAVGSIRRYIVRHENNPNARVRRFITTFHFPILLLHAMAFYFLCRLHSDMISPTQFDNNVVFFIWGYVAFLLLNVIWLLWLVWRREDRRPEMIWIVNNAVTALIGLGAFWGLRLVIADASLIFLLTCIVFVANSLIDLWGTADTYIAKSTEKA